MGATWSQIFPPAPTLTESNLPGQEGKVFVVTGGYSGVGEALSGILYGAGATVYIAGRSEAKAKEAITRIQARPATEHSPHGKLEFLQIDLSDLASIKPAAEALISKESRLDVLINNAGISLAALDAKSAQGHELTLATNCLGPLLFTLCLMPLLEKTASSTSPGSVRVVWTSSVVIESSPPNGMSPSDWLDPPQSQNPRYANSKTGNWFLASELAKRHAEQKRILSLTQNPGMLKTNILRNGHWILPWIVAPLCSPAVNGAYTELYSALSPELNLEQHGGAYVVPCSRLHPSPRKDLLNALKSKADGGTGRAEEFWNWCEEQIAPFR